MVDTISLTHTFRLPDELQNEALRLLAASRQTTNLVIEGLWDRLDEFKGGENQAWKQVTGMMAPPHAHGCRQWRCEAETAGRILRSQASRKAVFEQIQPVLADGLIFPSDGKRKARKNRQEMVARLDQLRADLSDDAEKKAVMLNLAEQACNFYIENGHFPHNYFEMQPVPLLKAGMLTYAGDDGGKKGQTYRYAILETHLELQLRTPDENGKWRWLEPMTMPLPEETLAFVKNSQRLCAPSLRAVDLPDGHRVAYLDIIVERAPANQPGWDHQENVLGFDWGVRKLLTVTILSPDGDQISRPHFLNTGGFDGKQARLRRQIDSLKAKRDRLPQKSARRKAVQREIDLGWNAYQQRNRALAHFCPAHFCAHYLLMLAKVYGCHAIAGEWLATLKTVGRGKYTTSRWRNWRNNTTIRSAITTLLKYKGQLAGVKLRFEQPRHTSHTCPHCGAHANTYTSPEHRAVNDWGAWLKCAACGWNGSRDYAASINIARLAVAFFKSRKENPNKKSYAGFRIDSPNIKPASYIGAGTALPFVPSDSRKKVLVSLPSRRNRNGVKNRQYFAGWAKSVTMSPILPTPPPVYI